MKLLLAFCFLFTPLHAKGVYPELVSADGSKTMRAKPIAVEGQKIRFEKENGKTFSAKPDVFAEKDQKNLREWMAAVEKSSHHALVRRVKSAKTLKVLFVGNSYSFQIPKLFETLAKSEGKSIKVEQVTKGGARLEQHSVSMEVLDKIKQGKWDVVVLQEQSIMPATPEHQRARVMYPAVKALADTARQSGAIPVLFQTWGRRDGDKQNAGVYPNDTFEAMHKRLTMGFKNASKHAGGIHIVPVGKVWRVLCQTKDDAGLYIADGSHPGKRGVYLGACVFYSALYAEPVKSNARGIKDAKRVAEAAAMAGLVHLPYPLHP